MAGIQSVTKLRQRIAEARAVDLDKLLRVKLGSASLQLDLPPLLDEIWRCAVIVERNADRASSAQAEAAIASFMRLRDLLHSQADRSDTEYHNYRETFLQETTDWLDSFRNGQLIPFFITEIDRSGILEKGWQTFEQRVDERTQEVLKQLEQQAKNKFAEAFGAVQRAEEQARRTAQGVSVSQAQAQFTSLQRPLFWQIILWGGLSVLLLGILFVVAFVFLSSAPQRITPDLFYSGIRLTILAAIGAAATYCLRILRAHLHMYQHNRHRLAVANSIEGFLAAANTPEQRDLILSRLVDSVVVFGQTGLVHSEADQVTPSRVALDELSRRIRP